MKAIIKIRLSGSIKEAVEDGIIKSGVMHACVENEVKYVLAGSIRDDGPLPDTIMDLIKAQEAYAEAIKDCGYDTHAIDYASLNWSRQYDPFRC